MNENGVLTDRTAVLAPGFGTTLTDARDVFIDDFTGDNWLDVVIANTFGQQPSFYRNAAEDSDGDWLGLVDESTRLPTISVPDDVASLAFCAVWGGDVDGQNGKDLYFANYIKTGGTKDVLLINNGSGTFTNQTTARLGTYANVAFGTSVEMHDVDNDGDRDIIKISTLYSVAPFGVGQFILFNDGTGVFKDIPFQSLSSLAPYMFSVGHLNNDGMLDQFLEGDHQDRVAIAQSLVPDSAVTYTTTALSDSPRTLGFGGNTKMADVDGDGDLDVGVAPIDVDVANCGPFSPAFALLQNPGNGLVFDPWDSGSQNFHLDPHDFAFLDVNNDTRLDIFMGLCTGWRVFIRDERTPVSLQSFTVD